MDERERILEIERRHRAQRAARMGRFKRWLKPLPRRANLARYPVIRHFGALAQRFPHLWELELPAVRRAIYIGALLALLPIYGLQLFFALVAAIVFRANLAVTCAFQVLTNPLTAGPLYYATYRTGMWVILTFDVGQGRGVMGTRFNALVLGGVLLGLLLGIVADIALRLAIWEARVLGARHAESRRMATEMRSREDAEAQASAGPAPAPGPRARGK